MINDIFIYMDKELSFDTREDFRDWLTIEGKTSGGVWILFGKNKSFETLSAEEALEEALCFGWIDGLINSIDESKYKKYFSPRTKNSKWSDKNKKLVEKLILEKKMTEPGLLAVEQAKKNGQWHKIHDKSLSETQFIEFESKLKINDLAYANYCAMSPSAKKQFVGFYFEAKQEETRQNRLEKIIGRLVQNKKLM